MSAYPPSPHNNQNHRFLSEVAEIRRRARGQIDGGGVTAGQGTDRSAVLRLLNAALATELVCAARYRHYCIRPTGALADALRTEFSKRALEEQTHAQKIAARIVELGGEPDAEPPHDPWGSSADGYPAEQENLDEMLAEDLIAERIAIDTYREIIRFIGDSDHTTRGLFESIVAVEQEHAAGLAIMREDIRRLDRAATPAIRTALAPEPLR